MRRLGRMALGATANGHSRGLTVSDTLFAAQTEIAAPDGSPHCKSIAGPESEAQRRYV